VAVLEGLGLDPEAQAVYRALLGDPRCDVSGLAHATSLDVYKVRRALDALVDLDLVRRSREDPSAVRPVDPEVGLSALLAARQAELSLREQEIATSRASLHVFLAEFSAAAASQARTAPDVEMLSGLDAVHGRLEDLVGRAGRELVLLLPDSGRSRDALELNRTLAERALRRGVTLRIVYLDSIKNERSALTHARWVLRLGAEVRTAPTLPLWVVLIDRSAAVVTDDPQPASVAARTDALLVRHAGLVAALTALVDSVWATARPLELVRPREAGLRAQEREMLRLLGLGCKDETVARQLGISVRTTRRMMADVMGRLRAGSRFQAGVRAAHLGWLDPADLSPRLGSSSPGTRSVRSG
jgi:DNA-binding CsgD family transcriptional regulator/sugar-specific transcriptional regulator TrmB